MIHSGLTDAWKLHTSPSYKENGFSSPVLLRGAGINETLTLRHLFRQHQLGVGTCSSCGFGGTCRCFPMLQESWMLHACVSPCPHDAPAPLCLEHQHPGTPLPPAASLAWSIPGRAVPRSPGMYHPAMGNAQLLPKGMQVPTSQVTARLREEQQQLTRKRN